MSTNHSIFILLLFFSINIAAQSFTYEVNEYAMPLSGKVKVTEIKEDYMPVLQNLEMPDPTGKSHRSTLMRLKEESKSNVKSKNSNIPPKVALDGEDIVVLSGRIGNAYNGSTPNDNDMSISNDGKVISVINTNIYMLDAESDSSIFTASLQAFAQPLGLVGSKYDPKTVYDPVEDRFIIVYLNGTLDSTSQIIVAFSKTKDPAGEWNLYNLPGNPLNNGTWSDYPIIGVSKDELFISINTFTNGSTNNSGFTESTFWQINKSKGYSGQTLETKYYSGLKLDGKAFFNITPVKGGSESTGPYMYLVSNRNLAVESDSVFLFKVSDVIANNPDLTVDVIKGPSYGIPPEARQANGHTFDTNDSRILGAFVEDSTLQFVGSTIVEETGFAGIYHGIINDLYSASPDLTANIIGDDSLDLGFPNISYSGLQSGDKEAVITAVHASPTQHSGFSAIYYGNDNKYSKVNYLQEGNAIVNVHGNLYERWGDYTGSQRKYNEPGIVWASGSYGLYRPSSIPRNVQSTWIAELKSPDSVRIPPFTPPVAVAFPNPVRDQINIYFQLENEQVVDINIYDVNGRLVKNLLQERAKKGHNQFTFSTEPLAKGIYFVIIQNSNEVIVNEKIVKQ